MNSLKKAPLTPSPLQVSMNLLNMSALWPVGLTESRTNVSADEGWSERWRKASAGQNVDDFGGVATGCNSFATILALFSPSSEGNNCQKCFFLCWTPVRGKLKNLLTDETVGKATASVFLFCFQGRCLWMYLEWYICAITVILRKKANLKWPRNDLCCNKIKKFYFSAKSLIGTGVTGIFTDNANHPNDTVAFVSTSHSLNHNLSGPLLPS